MRGNRPLRNHGVVNCGTFYEGFLCLSLKNPFGDFFYSLNRLLSGGAHLVDRDSVCIPTATCSTFWTTPECVPEARH
jgi:hypothetical protein